MGVGRVTALAFAGMALLWGLLYLASPFGYRGPLPCDDVNECDGPFVECQPPLLGGDLVFASAHPWANDAADRCERGGRRRLLAVGVPAALPLLAVVSAGTRRRGQLRSARR